MPDALTMPEAMLSSPKAVKESLRFWQQEAKRFLLVPPFDLHSPKGLQGGAPDPPGQTRARMPDLD